MDVMIDIETLGTAPTGVILSIGAVAFNGRGLHDEFVVNIDIESNMEAGRTVDANTIKWWFNQDIEVIKALEIPEQVPLSQALHSLRIFIGGVKANNIWVNGANFDFNILNHAYEHSVKPNDLPWRYKQCCCMRGIRVLGNSLGLSYGKYKKEHGQHLHNALEDAKMQANYVNEVFNLARKGVTT